VLQFIANCELQLAQKTDKIPVAHLNICPLHRCNVLVGIFFGNLEVGQNCLLYVTAFKVFGYCAMKLKYIFVSKSPKTFVSSTRKR